MWSAEKRGLVFLMCAIMLLGCSRSDPRRESRLADREDESANAKFDQSTGNRQGTAAPGQGESKSRFLELDQIRYQLSGPYVHGNLAVFFVHVPHQDDQEFLTLDEGLKKGLVKVIEKPNATVNELLIENQSELPLFLQEGDRLYGGNQDRTLFASLVIPAKSGPVPVPVFCIEPSRWSPARSGMRFGLGANPALAPLAVRNAAKLAKNQSQVWDQVKALQNQFAALGFSEPLQISAAGDIPAEIGTSSLNFVLESPAVLRLCHEYARALEGLLDDKPDAVGVAIAVHGRLVEVNVYPNHRLLRRMYSRLIQSYVLDAATLNDAKSAPAPTQDKLVEFLTAYQPRNKRIEPINQANRLEILELCRTGEESVELAECVTYFEGRQVHRQWVRPVGIAGERQNPVAPTGPANRRVLESPENRLLPQP